MKQPELLLIPVFSLADYYLTLVGSILDEKKYGNHYITDHYELNPVWQTVVAEKKWFNPKHLLLTLIEILVIVYIIEFGDMPETLVEFTLGFLFVGYGMIIGRHLRNILSFWYVIRKPDSVTGQVFTTHSLTLTKSMYDQVVVLVPLTLVLLFAPNPFVAGAALSCLLLMLIHVVWIFIYRQKQRKI